MSSTAALGIDIGATGIKAAIVNLANGEFVSSKVKMGTPEGGDPDDMAAVIKSVIQKLNWQGKVGCGFPGIIHHGVCKSTANISKRWYNLDVPDFLSKKTGGLPFKVANDADLAGLAELEYSAAGIPASGTVIFLTIGTGIGSALFYDSRLIPNTEFGHLYYKKNSYELYISNSARKRRKLSWNKWAVAFSHYLDHLNLLFSPDLIILGGGISKQFNSWGKLLTTRVPVQPATLENNAGIIGAAALWHGEVK